MKAIVHERYGMPDVLELREVDVPAIADDQVLLRVRASSVNPVEWYGVTAPLFVRAFGGGLRKPKSTKLGADIAGVVEAVGKDVTDLRPGDEVFGTSGAAWAEYAPAREVRLVRKPANVSFEEAAAVPVAALTALQALRDKGGVQPGQKVLINGASGGVGTFAVQIAKALGRGRDRRVQHEERRAGPLARGRPRRRLHPGGLHPARRAPRVMIDIAGSKPFRKFRRVLTPGATVVIVGAKFPSNKGIGPLGHMIGTILAALGRSQKASFFISKINKDDLELLGQWMEAGKMKPVVDKSFPLAEAADALRYLGTGHARGKVVLTM